jgi:hypothetical protein
MEGLAAFVTILLLVIYSSGLSALAFAWARSKWLRIASRTFAVISIVSGLWLAATLFEGNGVFVGGIPVVLGAVSLFISIRRNR